MINAVGYREFFKQKRAYILCHTENRNTASSL